MREPIQAVIFDLDGVLVDSEPNYLESERILLGAHGITFTAGMKVPYIGMSTREMLARVVVEFGLEAPLGTLVDQKNAIYLRLAAVHTPVNAPMRTLLELLHHHEYPLALASGSSAAAIEVVLSHTGLGSFFDVVVSADSVARGKPEPDLFLEAAQRLGVIPAACLVVEDSGYGVTAARRAGMRCIAIPYRGELSMNDAFAEADLLLGDSMANVDGAAVFAWIRDGAAAVTGNFRTSGAASADGSRGPWSV
jgi:HAD superfamily hydrolase (TIGR01509 family)